MKVKFDEIANFVAGQSPKSEFYSANEGIPFLQGNRTFGMFYPKIDTYTTKTTKIAHEGDILMSVRAPVGDLNFAPCELCIGRGLSAITAKNGDNAFLFYALKYNIQNLLNQSGGTTFDSVTGDVVRNMDMIIPEFSSHKKISELLYAIDGKIENNNKIISELESMAKTLYDYWFLQFEFPNEEGKPYKSSGGKMVWNEELKRDIPEGWSVEKLEKLVTTVDNRGKNPPYSDNTTNHPIIDVATLRNEGRAINYSECSKYVSDNTYDSWFRAGHPQKGDILFSTVGSLAETKLYYPDENVLGSIAQNVIGLRVSDNLWSYLYQILVTEKERIIGYRIGSVQPSLKVGHVLEHKIIIPIEICGIY